MSSKLHRAEKGAGAPIHWTPSNGDCVQEVPLVSGSRMAHRATAREDANTVVDEQAWQARVEQAQRAAYRQGEEAGASAAQQILQPMLERMARSIEQTATARVRFRHEAEQQVVALSLAIARRILHREVQIDPEALHGMVNAALSKLSMREITEVRVHPTQKASIEAILLQIGSPSAIRVVGDPTLEVGALLIESAAGTLDASVSTQFDEIGRGFADLVARR